VSFSTGSGASGLRRTWLRPSVIRRYGNLGSENEQYFVDGWLRTGDLGRVDEDGYFFITGSCKELIKRGGQSVRAPCS